MTTTKTNTTLTTEEQDAIVRDRFRNGLHDIGYWLDANTAITNLIDQRMRSLGLDPEYLANKGKWYDVAISVVHDIVMDEAMAIILDE